MFQQVYPFMWVYSFEIKQHTTFCQTNYSKTLSTATIMPRVIGTISDVDLIAPTLHLKHCKSAKLP